MTSVTRDVISDLWPLYLSDDLSADARRLVDDFLDGDPELARTLREAVPDPLRAVAPPRLPPDHELSTLQRVKRRLWGYTGLLQFAMTFSVLAFGRIVADTSWDVSPRNFIITAAIAVAFWVAFFITLYRGRYAILVRRRL